jgi:hypothetical protein
MPQNTKQRNSHSKNFIIESVAENQDANKKNRILG